MQVVYKEITSGGAKSIVEKWNLISEIQFKHVKNCPTVILYYNLVRSDGLWTLFSWCVMECKLFEVCVVSKGAENTF